MFLQPKNTKFRKAFKGRIKGNANKSVAINFGDYGLKALEASRMSARQIEAARRVIVRTVKRSGSLYIIPFPDTPVTSKPADVRMGKGKGSVDKWIAKIKPGNMIFELGGGISLELAKKAFILAKDKLSFDVVFVERIEGN